jgi:hypothetical protein
MKQAYLALALTAAACGAQSSPSSSSCDSGATVDLAGITPRTTNQSVTQYHNNLARDGMYIDPYLARGAVPGMHLDTTFNATTSGQAYTQPLFVDGGPGGRDLVIVGTTDNQVTAFDAASGAIVWRLDQTTLGPPADGGDLPCGNIKPVQGMIGTGAIDLPSRTFFFDVLTEPESKQFKHLIHRVSLDDGSERPGYPIDPGARFDPFDSSVQGQRGGLLIVNNNLYVPYGGMWGDCGVYNGYIIEVPIDDPDDAVRWHTGAFQAGIWGPSGLASDGTSLFATTGNSYDQAPFSDQESLLRFDIGPVGVADKFTPLNWMRLDTEDLDLAIVAPVLFDGPNGEHLTMAIAKDTTAYLLDRDNLGGMGGELASAQATTGQFVSAAVAYKTSQGLYVVNRGPGANCPNGESGNLFALRITNDNGNWAITTAWCADQHGKGVPIVSTTDGTSDPVVWAVGAEGDNQLHAFDPDTGVEIASGCGGGGGGSLSTVHRFTAPIVAKGRIFVAGDGNVYAFKP